MTDRISKEIEAQLSLLAGYEKVAAKVLGDHFPQTYAARAYRLERLGRGWPYPSGRDTELLEYVQLTFGATYLRDRFRCVYCDLDGLASPGNYAAIQIDHLVPLATESREQWGEEELWFIRGYSPDNLACACQTCNASKSHYEHCTLRDRPRSRRIELAIRGEQRRRDIVTGKPKERFAEIYNTQVHEVAAFVAAYQAMLKFVGGVDALSHRV